MGHHIVLNSQNCGGIPMVLVTFLLDPYKNKISRPHTIYGFISPCLLVCSSNQQRNHQFAPGHHAVILALARLQRDKRALGKELLEAALRGFV